MGSSREQVPSLPEYLFSTHTFTNSIIFSVKTMTNVENEQACAVDI